MATEMRRTSEESLRTKVVKGAVRVGTAAGLVVAVSASKDVIRPEEAGAWKYSGGASTECNKDTGTVILDNYFANNERTSYYDMDVDWRAGTGHSGSYRVNHGETGRASVDTGMREVPAGVVHVDMKWVGRGGSDAADFPYDAASCPLPTESSTETATPIPPTETPRPTKTAVPSTSTPTPTEKPTITSTFTATNTETSTSTQTPIPPSDTPTPIDTDTPVTITPEGTVVVESPTPSNTPVDTETAVPSDTPTATPRPTDTDVPSDTPTAVNTQYVETPSATQAATSTVGPTSTPEVARESFTATGAGGEKAANVVGGIGLSLVGVGLAMRNKIRRWFQVWKKK